LLPPQAFATEAGCKSLGLRGFDGI